MYGSGEQTRSFQYVDDLVEGLVRLMNSDYKKPVNLGNPDEFTVEELAMIVKEMIGILFHIIIILHDLLVS